MISLGLFHGGPTLRDGDTWKTLFIFVCMVFATIYLKFYYRPPSTQSRLLTKKRHINVAQPIYGTEVKELVLDQKRRCIIRELDRTLKREEKLETLTRNERLKGAIGVAKGNVKESAYTAQRVEERKLHTAMSELRKQEVTDEKKSQHTTMEDKDGTSSSRDVTEYVDTYEGDFSTIDNEILKVAAEEVQRRYHKTTLTRRDEPVELRPEDKAWYDSFND
ncbi:hypothetical protein B0O99DRAFT_591022 [Bisporella sp. PMI_857]|nr:hypothetical protein B0O99DRAFT_591022 [Bisporella sp. PMI_857]